MNINYAVIGRQIRVWRGRRNLTQERLAGTHRQRTRVSLPD